MDVGGNAKEAAAEVVGMLIAAHAVVRFGTAPEQPMSNTAGAAWSMWNYAVAIMAGWLGAKILRKVGLSDKLAGLVYRGAWVMVMQKALWHRLLYMLPAGRGPAWFGNVPDGTVRYDDNGNVLYAANGQWMAMQGMDGLAEATPLGGELQQATPLGATVDADPWFNGGDMGHILTSGDAGSPADDWGMATWRGSADPYAAAFM